MGLKEWHTRRKAQRAFSQAMDSGDFAAALEAAGTGEIDSEQVAEAERKHTLAEALMGRNVSEADVLEPLLSGTLGEDVLDKLDPVGQALVLLAQVRAAAADGDYDQALSRAKKMRDGEAKAVAYRAIAGHLAAASQDRPRAAAVLLRIGNQQYVLEEFRNLVMSCVFADDLEAVDFVMERLGDSDMRSMLASLVSFVREHDTLEVGEEAAEAGPADQRPHRLVLMAGRSQEYSKLLDHLRTVHPDLRDSTRMTYATSLAYAARFEPAVAVVKEIYGEALRHVAMGYLLTHFPLPSQVASELFSELATVSDSSPAASAWLYEVSGLLFSGRYQEAVALAASIKNSNLQRMVVATLVDQLCQLQAPKGAAP